jgi:hypothetical protein
MHRSLTVVVLCVVLIGGCNKNDLSTPKSAAKSFATALEAGDAEAAKAASTGDPKMVEGMAKAAASMKRLRDAAVAKYGDAGKSIAGDDNFSDMAKNIDAATEQITGDNATLTMKTGDPLTLKKIGGEWKVDVAAMMGPAAGMGVALFDSMSKAAGEVADEIKSDKHKTAADASAALQQKMMSGMFNAPNPGG